MNTESNDVDQLIAKHDLEDDDDDDDDDESTSNDGSQEDAGNPSNRPRHVTPTFTLEQMSPVFEMPMQAAAKQLGVSPSSLKRSAERIGLDVWPYRRVSLSCLSKKNRVLCV
jgi:hypothetical protein